MTRAYPAIGKWFKRPDGTLLEVVAVDEEDKTIEVQFYDGPIDEVDIDTWGQQFMVEASAPEDWSGSVDMDPEDYKGTASNEMPAGFHDPLEFMKE